MTHDDNIFRESTSHHPEDDFLVTITEEYVKVEQPKRLKEVYCEDIIEKLR